MKTNKIITAVLIVGIPLISLAVRSAFSVSAQNDNALETFAVKVDQAKISSNCSSVEFSGFVRGKNQADIAAKVAGRITRIPKKEGATVQAGEVIAFMDSKDAVAETGIPSSALENAKNIKEETKKYYDRLVDEAKNAKDQAKDSGDDDAYDAAKKAYESAKAARNLQVAAAEGQIFSAQAMLHSAETQLADFTLTAPFSGTIIRLYREEGNFAGPGIPILTIAGPENLEIISSVSTENSKNLRVGQLATLSSEDKKFQGKIMAISPAGDPLSQRTQIRLSIDSNNDFSIGDFIRAEVDNVAQGSFLTVSQKALFQRYDDTFVSVVEDDGTVNEKKIRFGQICGERIVVESGIKEGDRIIIEGREKTTHGEKVELYGE